MCCGHIDILGYKDRYGNIFSWFYFPITVFMSYNDSVAATLCCGP